MGCTKNPHRICAMCDNSISPVAELSAIVDKLGDLSEEEMMQELRTATDGCPACMLAAIRQSETFNAPRSSDPEEYRHWFTFDYKKEAAEYLEEKRHDEAMEFRHIVAGF